MANVTPPQFSLRTLMVVTIVAAVIASLGTMSRWFADPLLLLISTAAVPVLVLCVIYATRPVRAFCIGALLPAATFAVSNLMTVHRNATNPSQMFDYFDHMLVMFAGGHFRSHCVAVTFMSIVSGLSCLVALWMLDRASADAANPAPKRKPPPPPRPRRDSTRIIFEFAGGPMDGKTVIGDAGDQGEAERYYLLTNRGQVGQRFSVASHYAVDLLSQDAPHDKPPVPRHVYEVTGQLEGDDEVLVRAEYVRRSAERSE